MCVKAIICREGQRAKEKVGAAERAVEKKDCRHTDDAVNTSLQAQRLEGV